MSKDENEGTEPLPEKSDTPSENNEENLELFEDDPSDDEGADEPTDWEARAKKAEKKVVDLKRQVKTSSKEDTEAIVEKKIAEREFFKENPDAKDYEKEIKDYVSKGISLDKAYKLVKLDHEGEDRSGKQTRSNRATLPNAPAPTKSRYTLAELEKLPQSEYNAIRAKIDKGEVTIG